ncbi:MAG: DNA repair protein [Aliishimia sp.]
MPVSVRAFVFLIQFLLQRAALIVFACAALALLVATILAAFGQMQWLGLDFSWNGTHVPQAGMYAQIGLTVLAVSLCFFLPTNRRIMVLENSHRQFAIGMQDIARAYAAVHAADRNGTFQMSSEFDAVRERLAYLRDHPDLSSLEPALLEVAAQMSHVSKELAEVYSDDTVTRARDFLRQRQQEVEQFNTRIDHAKSVSTELKHWLHEVELEESVAAAQLDRLRSELREVLPELGLETIVRTDNTVVELPPKAAE